jgi:hypothetical protein
MHPFRAVLSDLGNDAGTRLARMRARLRTMRGRDLAIGFGGLLAGVALAGLAIQAPKQKPPAPSTAAMPAHASPEPESASPEQKNADAATPIKIIGASTGAVPCDQQTWPYIERRCLTEAPPRQDEPAAHAAAPVPTPAAIAPVQERTVKAIEPSPAVEEKTTEMKPVQAVAVTEPRKAEAKPAETTGVGAKREAIPVKETGSLPAKDEAKSEPASERKKVSRRDEERRTRREHRQQEAARDNDQREAGRREQDGRKIVKRWRELVYDYPDGTRKRIIVDGSRASAKALPIADDD